MKETLHRELEDRVAEAMERLPFDQRTVFVLRTSEGLSYQEISEQLNVSVGTVMSRLSRAREKLRDLLKPYLDVED
jgi:RNA polymerase sigma-70 factor (ECF subfamily)